MGQTEELDTAAEGNVSGKEHTGGDGLARTEVPGEGEERQGLNHSSSGCTWSLDLTGKTPGSHGRLPAEMHDNRLKDGEGSLIFPPAFSESGGIAAPSVEGYLCRAGPPEKPCPS